ncbi:MAG TPA: aldo/keto reductase [Anaerolineales bacterium]|nr:aldo/keto reductase [Anaerolineales bacterium]
MRYKRLGQSGLHVSELCLGTMTFGDDWGWGAPKEESRKIFEVFAEAGGNFIDTAGNYTNGTSEKFIGEFINGERDRFVIATKYTLRVGKGHGADPNLGGNSRKSMVRAVENSLKRLKTDYIDLLYLHMWDFRTPVEEVLQSVHHLVASGKVLYFAFSDTPAWVVSYAIAKAMDFGWTRPVALQVPYSLLDRSVERAELPMAREHGLAILPWGILESGVLTGKYSHPSDEPRRESAVGERELQAGEAVAKVARETGHSPAQVTINWIRQQPGNIIPILGCRTLVQIQDNLGCLDFRLSDAQIDELSSLADFKLGFPLSFLESDHVGNLIFGETLRLLDTRPAQSARL